MVRRSLSTCRISAGLVAALVVAAVVITAVAQQRLRAQVELRPAPLYFGSVGLATAATRPVTLMNFGPSPLSIASGYPVILGNNANDFAVTSSDCGRTVAAGQRCALSITFTPMLKGARTAVLKFVDDGDASPRTVTLTGVGQ